MKKYNPELGRTNSDYENESHLSRKKKAEANAFHAKNQKQIIDLIDIEDDEEDLDRYIRYIK